jgi:glycerophosphoryl diester phosphodiesterase
MKQVALTAWLLFSVMYLPAQQAITLPRTAHKLVVIAHRGDHVNVPENTLAAYQQAIIHGADYVEVDLRTTKDGHLVILHDATVNRMTGGTGAVKDLAYDDIRRLTIHAADKKDTAVYHIPDFASVLKLCRGRINIYLDFKDADVAKTYRMIRAADMEKHVVVYLNKEEQYGQWKKIAPQMPLMASLPENMDPQQLIHFLEKKPVQVVDNAYNDDLLKLMRRKNIAVWLDVESKDEGPAIWDKVLQKGVDGLQTDHPEKLIKYLEEKGIR